MGPATGSEGGRRAVWREGARDLPAAACRSERMVVVWPRDLNTYHSVFGGYVMQRVDALATALAADVSGLRCVTAHLDRLTFTAGIGAFQRMRLTAWATRTFRTSMEVQVDVQGEDSASGRTWQTAHATLTVVGLDDGGRPAPLPQVVPSTPREWEDHRLAAERREKRLALPDPVPAEFGAPPAARADALCLESTSRVVPAAHAAENGQASAGWILALADELAAISASRHAGVPTVTVAVDQVAFRRPVPIGDILTLRSYLTCTFRTSLEVRVDAFWRPRYGRAVETVAHCAFTFVAVGADGRPVPLTGLVPQGEREEALARVAWERRRERLGAG